MTLNFQGVSFESLLGLFWVSFGKKRPKRDSKETFLKTTVQKVTWSCRRRGLGETNIDGVVFWVVTARSVASNGSDQLVQVFLF